MIVGKLLDGLNAAEFDRIMSQFIEAEDPDAMSLEALDEAARKGLALHPRGKLVKQVADSTVEGPTMVNLVDHDPYPEEAK